MNAFIEAQMTVVRQIQAERRAEADVHRLVAHQRRHRTALRHGEHRAGWRERLAVAGADLAPAAQRRLRRILAVAQGS